MTESHRPKKINTHESIAEPRSSRQHERYSRSRRRLLQSLAAGGAAVTVKTIPENWAKPALDVTIVPVHAETSVAASLTCEVDVPGTSFDGNIDFSVNPPDGGTWLVGGKNGTIDEFSSTPVVGGTTVVFDFFHVEATVMPVSAGPITLNVNADGGANGGNAVVNAGANQVEVPNGAGVVDFDDDVVVGFDSDQASSRDTPSTATVHFNFSAGGQDCVINVVFAEGFLAGEGP